MQFSGANISADGPAPTELQLAVDVATPFLTSFARAAQSIHLTAPLKIDCPIIALDNSRIGVHMDLFVSGGQTAPVMTDELNDLVNLQRKRLQATFPDRELQIATTIFEGQFTPQQIYSFRALRARVRDLRYVAETANGLTLAFETAEGIQGASNLIRSYLDLSSDPVLRRLKKPIITTDARSDPADIFSDWNKLERAVFHTGKLLSFTDQLIIDGDSREATVLLEPSGLSAGKISKKAGKLGARFCADSPADLRCSANYSFTVAQQFAPRQITRAALATLEDHSISALRVDMIRDVPHITCLADLSLQERTSITRAVHSDHFPEDISISFVNSSHPDAATAFEVIPPEWGLRQIISSNDDSAVFLRCTRPPELNPEIAAKLAEFEALIGKRVYVKDNSYQPLPADDPRALMLRQFIPTGADLRELMVHAVTDEIKIISGRKISPDVLKDLKAALSASNQECDLHNDPLTIRQNIPHSLKSVVGLIRQAGPLTPKSIEFSRDISVQGYGACESVGGSCFMVQFGGASILLDCGARFGDSCEGPALSPEAIAKTDFVVLSHAHTDHCGWLPWLYANGCTAPLITTEPSLMVADYTAREYHNRNPRFFDNGDIAAVYGHAATVKLGVPYPITDDVTVTLHNAGHTLGSAMVQLTAGSDSFAYSGDYMCQDTMLHNGASTAMSAKRLLLEGTYGTEIFPERSQVITDLQEAVIDTLVNRRGIVLIPALAVGRSQEVLSILWDMRDFFIEQKGIGIFIDGAIPKLNDMYRYCMQRDPGYFNNDAQDTLRWLQSPDTLFKPIVKSNRASLISDGQPKVVVSTAGMLQGLSDQYFQQLSERDLLVLTSYQVEGTKGRRLVEHVRSGLHAGEFACMPNRVHEARLRGHSDLRGAVQLLQAVQPEEVLLNHGESQQLLDLQSFILSEGLAQQVHVLKQGDRHPLAPHRGI